MSVKTTVLNPKWVQVKRVVPKFVWRTGHPAGYTDDLGFTAARGKISKGDMLISGWISDIDPHDYGDMREWCEQNLKHSDWCTGVYYIILQREEDVAWFMLRWS
jgi:hypothetical protein